MKDADIEKIAELVTQKLAVTPNWVYTPPQYPYYPYRYPQWYGWSTTSGTLVTSADVKGS